VRYYGLYAPRARKELSLCRSQLGQQPVREPDEIDWQSYCEARGAEHLELCPVCGNRLIRIDNIPRISIPMGVPDEKEAIKAA